MHAVDWLLMLAPLLAVAALALYTRRYARSVADFMAGGRAAGRYLLCTARGEQGTGAVMFVGLFEVFSQAGFTTQWWQQISVPVALVVSSTGFVYYRYRQTRALTLAQFFELRYSRRFRIFTGALGFVAGICNFGIIPCIGARFFVSFLDLPQRVPLFSASVPTYLVLMACFLSASTLLTLSGGQVTMLAVNCVEGMFSQIVFVVMLVALLAMFGWGTMHQVLLHQPAGQSLSNPFDSFSIHDFNLWWVLMSLFLNNIYGAMAWQNNHAFNASGITPHDARMGNLLTRWKEQLLLFIVVLMGMCALTYLQHPAFAAGAAQARAAAGRIADPGTASQMLMPIALAHLLPVGIKGLVCAMILMGVISGDAIHLHSWSSIFVQDVILPLRRRPLSVRAHLFLLRAGIVGVAVFAYVFGSLFKQTEYVLMWFQVTTAIFVGGAGSAIIGGLYWSRGTNAGAWVGLLTGSTLCVAGILERQWHQNFPLNGSEISFGAALVSIAAYVLVSWATCRVPHDMDRLLHRGRFAVEPEGGAPVTGPRRGIRLDDLMGIDEHYTRGDRWVTHGIFWWSMFWFALFVVVSLVALVHPLSAEWWTQYWRVAGIWLPLAALVVTTVWFTIGCTQDLRVFFRRLREERIDPHDDGSVERPAASASGPAPAQPAVVLGALNLLAMPTKRPSRVSLRDVAQASGVSTMMVSLALRGNGRVPPPTVQRIRETALRLGYMPNPKLSQMMSEMARTRYSSQSGTLAFMAMESMPGGLGHAEEKSLRAAVVRAGLYGYQVQRYWLMDPALPPRRLNQILWNRGIEGIIIPNVSGQLYARGVHTLPIEWEKFCVIEIGGSMLQPAVNRVRHDHFGAMVKALHRLEGRGYRRIGLCLTSEVDLRTHHRWSAAYLLWQAFRPEAAGIRPLLVEVVEPARVVAWARENRLDAVLSPGHEFLSALRAGGLDIPGDIGFASLHVFGPEAAWLAGVDQDDSLLVSSAVDMLVTLIQRRERGVPEHPTEILSMGHWQEGQTLRAEPAADLAGLLDLDEQRLSF